MRVRLKTLLNLIRQTREIRRRRETDPAYGEVLSAEEGIDALGRSFSNPLLLELKSMLEGLSLEEKVDIAAICAIGRGYDGTDWDEVRKESEGIVARKGITNFMHMNEAEQFLADGMKILIRQAEEAGEIK